MSTDFVSRGQALLAAGQFQEAVKICRLGLLGRPTDVAGRVLLGQALLSLRRFDEVVAEMRVALELEPSNAAAYMLRGEALLRKGDASAAVDALGRASKLAPADLQIAALLAEAEEAAASEARRSSTLGFGDAADGETKHYPTNLGAMRAPSPHITKPVSLDEAPGSRRNWEDIATEMQPRPPGPSDRTATMDLRELEALAQGDKSSTVEIDPEFELGEDDLAEPPGLARGETFAPLGREANTEPSLEVATGEEVIDVDAGDVLARRALEPRATLRGPSVLSDSGEIDALSGDFSGEFLTGSGGEPPGRGVTGPTSTIEAGPRSRGAPPPVGSTSQTGEPMLKRRPADLPLAPPSSGRTPVPDVDWKSPPLSVAPPPAAPADLGPRGRQTPPGAPAGPRGDSPRPRGEGAPRERAGTSPSGEELLSRGSEPSMDRGSRPSRDEDMRMIRVGLGMSADATGSRSAIDLPPPSKDFAETTDVSDEPGAMVDETRVATPVVEVAMGPPVEEAAYPEPGVRPRTRKGRPIMAALGTLMDLAPPRLRSFVVVAWIALAIAVISGGVWAGFQIRDIRLSRQIAAARRAAETAAITDTWSGWKQARDILAGVVEAQDTAAHRAAVARARAVLAAEFGDDLPGARTVVAQTSAAADTVIARGYLAIADGDPVAAVKAASAAQAAAPGDGASSYLTGRAALLDARADAAVEAFRAALRIDARPLFYVGLAEAEAARRKWPEAKAACKRALEGVKDHPAATIAQARILAASGELAENADPGVVTALEGLITAGERPAEAGDSAEISVAPAEAAMAAVALAEVHLARGDGGAARQALGRALSIAQRVAAPEPLDGAPGSEQRRFAEAVVAIQRSLGDVEGAEQVAVDAAKQFPGSLPLQVALADLAMMRGEAARSLEILSRLGDLSRWPAALAVRGRARLALGDLDAAAADLDAALALDSELELAVVARAELDLARGDARTAAERLEPLYEPASPPQLANVYGAALREIGEREQARSVLSRVTASASGAAASRGWLELARLERDLGDLRAARAGYTKAIELSTGGFLAQLEAALLAIDASDPVAARTALDALAKAAPEDGRILVEAARIHTLLGDREGARALLDRAEPLASAPRWQLARERGRIALRARSAKVAVESLERAVGLMPDDGETRLLLIDAHLLGDGEAAKRALTDVAKRFAGRPEVLLARGRVEYFVGNNRAARATFARVRDQLVKEKAAPRRIADAMAWLGRIAYEKGDEKKNARTLLTRAVELDPANVDAWLYLGFNEEELKSTKGAAAAFAKVAELDPDNIDNWFNLGKSAAAVGDKKQAKRALEEFLKRAPKSDDAADAKALLEKL